ncbi:hypothetical protein [Streptomyces sp. ISL-86]|uniref:hypothetical protein n=1 Tax=Streptomyces sp. ISL-86 TaxID=2819187 RepID=UPI001BEC106A|nr:hypothetical protein [Streptomyces sp. ISL-86]
MPGCSWQHPGPCDVLPVAYPEVDWPALRALGKGRRSPLAALTAEEHQAVNLAQLAQIAGVGRAAAANWRRRHPDFPAATGGTEASPTFERGEAVRWLRAHGKLHVPARPRRSATVTVAGGQIVTLCSPDLMVRDGWEELGGFIERDAPMPWPRADLARVEIPGHAPVAVDQAHVDISHAASPTRRHLRLTWRADRRRSISTSGESAGD